ncbi:MAG: late embryosis abundant protein [Gammaproteobacteria bacterium]|nr:late embryosis abundant protein [Gammaproteobacteria bacterium]
MAEQTVGTQAVGTGRQAGSGSSYSGEKAAAQSVAAAKSVADQALSASRDLKAKAMGLAGSSSDAIKDQVSEFIDTAKDAAKNAGADYVNLAETIRRAAGEFDGDFPIAGTFIREVASQVDVITTGNLKDILEDARSFAHRQPTALLGIAVLVGFGLVRFLKSSADHPQIYHAAQGGGGKIEVEVSNRPRNTTPAKITSKGRGRPLADLVQKIERAKPDLASARGLSSAAMRAGDLVRAMRKAAGLSQSQLAERLGVTQARMSEIESGIGRQGPTWDLMERISAACGRTLGVAVSRDQREELHTSNG